MILQATHTHLYPGHRGQVFGLARLVDLHTGRDCLVEFSDGSATAAKITKTADGWQLRTSAYRTAAGTDIPAKLWRVGLYRDRDQVNFRILNKAPQR